MAKKKTTRKRKRRELDIVKLNTIKRYVREVLDIQVSTSSADRVRARFNDLIKTTLRQAKANARADKKKTMLARHIDAAIVKHVGKKNLEWQEIVREIKRLNAIDIGEVAKAIREHVKKEKAKRE